MKTPSSLKPMSRRFYLVLVVVLTFSLGSVSAAARAFDPARTTQTQTIDLKDFGAIGDGVADDGPAFQQALDALAAQGGGTLLVPAGRYAIVTPVVKDLSGIASITIQGAEPEEVDTTLTAHGLGLSSEFLIRVGESQTAVSLKGVQTLSFQDVTFIGDPDVEIDALTVLWLSEIKSATIRHCEFYGVATFDAGGAIVHADRSDLTVVDSAFLGCSANSGLNTSVIENTSWRGITVTGTRMIDYGIRPEFYSKTPLSPPYAWIDIGDALPAEAPNVHREVLIRDVFLDEGAYLGISCQPSSFSSTYTPINLIFISGLTMNVTNLGSSGVYLEQAERVFIEKSFFGWSHNADSAVHLLSVGEAILDQVTCVEEANRIRADENTGWLTVVNSTYQYLDSLAPYTSVVTTASLDDDPVQYVRQQYLATVGREPDAQSYFDWASLLLKCGEDQACVTQTRASLANYLAGGMATYAISGQAANQSGAPIVGVTVTLSGAQNLTTTTDDNGAYRLAGVRAAGPYNLSAASANYDFGAATIISGLSSDLTVNFSGTINAYKIRGHTGVGGVNVMLSGDANASTQSGPDGAFSFNVDPGGSYTITPISGAFSFTPGSQSFANLSGDQIANFVASPKLMLLTEENSDDAIALGSVTLLSGPFALTTDLNFSSDHRTRIMVFAVNLQLNPGEELSAMTAQAEDSLNTLYPLTLEFIAPVAGHPDISQVNLKLPAEFPPGGHFWISIKLHDQVSNRVHIAVLP